MNVASLELCQELYELSDWGDKGLELTWHHWYEVAYVDPLASHESEGENAKRYEHASVERRQLYYDKPGNGLSAIKICPAYSLGCLLRKLPDYVKLFRNNDGIYFAAAVTGGWKHPDNQLGMPDTAHKWYTANTPEDAACKLAIELFKQGVLTKETPHA